MAISKEQAVTLGKYGSGDIHVGTCTRRVGPRGGVTESITRVRPSGRCQTWVTRPDEFRLPIKFGLYQHGEITERNAAAFHLPWDCPIGEAQARGLAAEIEDADRGFEIRAVTRADREKVAAAAAPRCGVCGGSYAVHAEPTFTSHQCPDPEPKQ